MTDNSIPINTHTAPFLDAITGSIHRSTADANPSPTLQQAPEEDEPYTIKCICGFAEDDGNTVFCEACETWQHIECYYSQKKVPDVHNCIDCVPRSIDTRSANERQRRRKEKTDVGDKKPKRPQGKSHRKKVKVSDQNAAQVNGWGLSERPDNTVLDDRRSGSPRDQPPVKKPKTNHRGSSSMSSQAGTPALVVDRRKRAESNPHNAQSPAKYTTNQAQTNGYHSEPYSLEFLQLYEDDPGDMPMQANLFNTIGITSSLSFWVNDRDALAQATNGRSPQDVFHWLDRPFESLNFPGIQKHVREDRNAVYSGRHPVWQYLTVDASVPEGHVVGELKGQIGHMDDYCQDPVNRWQTLRHPVPFVFFHPQLPIYIDTRNEGTLCRYVRRSCRPNLKMKTVLTDEREVHFCFVATEPLEAGTEITIGWVLDENIRKYLDRAHFGTRGDGSIKQEGLAEAEADYISLWVGKVLADFGGCACNSPQHCTLAQFDRRSSTASIDFAIHLPNGRSKKAKHGLHHHNSPHSAGQATGSRACSENPKYREEDDQDDSRSTSGSTHSKAHSRDRTPAARFSNDFVPAPGPELSDREKRKIAAAERTFEQLAHDNKVQRRKKRTGGGSHPSTPSLGTSVRSAKALQVVENYANPRSQKQLGHLTTSTSQPDTPDVSFKPQYVDWTTSQRRSCSPTTGPFQTPNIHEVSSGALQGGDSIPSNTSRSSRPPRLDYVDSTMQTEQDHSDAWVVSSSATSKRKHYVSLTRRLLQRCHQDRIRLEHGKKVMGDEAVEAKEKTSGMAQNPEDPPTQSDIPVPAPPQAGEQSQEDVEMKDVDPDPRHSPVSNLPDTTLEKPRPPDEPPVTSDPSSLDHAPTVKPPPPPWPTSVPEPTCHSPPPSNGYKPMELRVQLPPTPIFSSNPSTTAIESGITSSTSNTIAQSPSTLGSHSYPAPFPSSVTQMVQPSPVKKKLSLGDYMSRKSNKAETASTEKGQQGNSPTTPQSIFKPPVTIKEPVLKPTSDAPTIVESPRTEDHPDLMTVSKDPGG